MKGVVIDGDRTAWKGNAAEMGIGIPYILSALRRVNLVTATKGIRGYFEVKKLVKSLPAEERDVKGLILFYRKLSESKLGRPTEMYLMAQSYLQTHRIKESWQILMGFTGPRFLASMNGSNVALAASAIFRFDDFVSNQDLFEGGRLSGVSVRMRNGEDKLREVSNMLSKLGIRLNQCFAIGDSITDIPMLREAGLAIASPFATPEIMGISDYWIDDESLLDPTVTLRR